MQRLAAGLYGALAAALIGLVVMLMWSESKALQIYPPHTQWHLSRNIPVGTFVNAFTVPAGVDLTITDIVYDFGGVTPTYIPPNQYQGHGGTCMVTVSDGGPNQNVTTNNPFAPVFNTGSTVSDTASYRFWNDIVRTRTDPGGGNPVRWSYTDPLEDDLYLLEFQAFAPTTISHHFQTGLFIPEGNDLLINVNFLGAGSVNVMLHGRLN